MEKLRKCPFCGGEASVIKSNGIWYFIECMSCDIKTPYYFTREEAIEAWNRRVE